jgi:hypothetical protein
MSTADMVRMMLDLTREQLRELRNPPPAAYTQGNPAEMAVALATAMQQSTAPLLTAIVERASQPAPDMVAQLTGMIELMKAVREMSAPPEASGWDRIADRLATPLGSLLTQHVENQANGTAPPSTMGAGPFPNPPGADMPDRPAWYPLLRPHLPHLIQLASAGRNPEVSADFIADSIPDQYIPVIYESLSRPTFQDELVAHVPEVGPHRPWFGAFAARVLEWFSPPSDDADAAGAPPEIGTGVAPEGDEG